MDLFSALYAQKWSNKCTYELEYSSGNSNIKWKLKYSSGIGFYQVYFFKIRRFKWNRLRSSGIDFAQVESTSLKWNRLLSSGIGFYQVYGRTYAAVRIAEGASDRNGLGLGRGRFAATAEASRPYF